MRVTALLALSGAIDALTRFVGYHVRWLILAAIIVSAVNALIRKLFDVSSNGWLELQWLLFGAVFMLAAAYTLQRTPMSGSTWCRAASRSGPAISSTSSATS